MDTLVKDIRHISGTWHGTEIDLISKIYGQKSKVLLLIIIINIIVIYNIVLN